MIRRPPRSTRTDTLFPYTTLFRSTLTHSGLVTVKSVGNQKHYQANPDSPIFTELCAIVQKTTGLADPLRAALMPMASQITAAFVYGSVAKKTDTASSDIDLMLISNEVSYRSEENTSELQSIMRI